MPLTIAVTSAYIFERSESEGMPLRRVNYRPVLPKIIPEHLLQETKMNTSR
ncbi:MAG: hypothetical protein ACLR2D_06415 [Anaerobutyricum hallii]